MTYCEQCDHCMKPFQSARWFQWLCMKHPRVAQQHFVAESNELDDPPYLQCKQVNGGACVLFEPIRNSEEK